MVFIKKKILKQYDFRDCLLLWIKLFNTHISSTIQNNGCSLDFFNVGRSVRQGCSLSAYLFIICAGILGAAVRRDKLILGIQISENECKINQYADDTTFILDGTKSSIQKSFLLLRQITHIHIFGIGLELSCNRGYCGESFQMQITFIFFFNDIPLHEPAFQTNSNPIGLKGNYEKTETLWI